MQRLRVLAVVALILFCSACGAGERSAGPPQAQQPTDPRSVPTATLPAILPSAMPAATVTDGSVSGQLNVVPTSYTVKPNDTMAKIAQQLGVPVALLLSYNPDVNPNALIVGQVLRVPPPPTVSPATTPAAGVSSAQRTATPASGSAASRTATPFSPATGTARGTPASTSAAGATGASSASGQTYRVKAGDTGCVIAARLHVSLADLASVNGLTIAQMQSLKVGQQLQVPQRQSASPGC